MSQEQNNLIRQSLLNSVFTLYTELTKTIKTLPFDPNTPGLLKVVSFIDDGIVWAKEVILNSPLVMKTETVKPIESVPEVPPSKPVEPPAPSLPETLPENGQ